MQVFSRINTAIISFLLLALLFSDPSTTSLKSYLVVVTSPGAIKWIVLLFIISLSLDWLVNPPALLLTLGETLHGLITKVRP